MLGRLILKWRRPRTGVGSAESSLCVSETAVPLPPVQVRSVSKSALMSIHVPPDPRLGRVMEMNVVLENRGTGNLELGMRVSPSDSFLFSGYRHVQVRLLPKSRIRVPLRVVPIVVGQLTLPLIQLRWLHGEAETMQQSLPTRVFVLPPPPEAQSK
eukprot:Tamp_30949.p1 GENE.Tamp_30949~~Tamp_30949.p1  ORF type:complete len:156 (-),score=0.77 Tamp_30949:30-497(-)